jgi:hypothetical protein
MLEGFCFAAFFLPFFQVVTLCMFPSVGWVTYEVLLFAVYVIFGTVICVLFSYLCFVPVLFSLVIFVVSLRACVCVCVCVCVCLLL